MVGLYDTIVAQFFPRSGFPTMADWIPEWQWWSWVIVLLVLTVIAMVEGSYRLQQGNSLMPSESEIEDAVQLLVTETVVMKHNNGDERSYSVAQILLAIADRLTNGISDINFEHVVRIGLAVGEGWYFPYEVGSIAHVIGVLYQNALIERHIEEQQHTTRELVGNDTGFHLSPPHLVKNTEARFYLSSLGSRVIQRLHKGNYITATK